MLGNPARILYHLGNLEGLAMIANLTQLTKSALIDELEHWRDEVPALIARALIETEESHD